MTKDEVLKEYEKALAKLDKEYNEARETIIEQAWAEYQKIVDEVENGDTKLHQT